MITNVLPAAVTRASSALKGFLRAATGIGSNRGFFTEKRLRVYSIIVIFGYAEILFRSQYWLVSPNGNCTDFVWIWLSSKLALAETPTAAYDYAEFSHAHAALSGFPSCVLQHFDYPPTLLFFTYPLGSLPYSAAFAAWTVCTMLLYLATVYAILPHRDAVLAALTPLPVVTNIFIGNDGFLTASFVGLALVLMERRPRLSGVFIGCLTYKPQFGILFPLALLASRNWRALLSAAAVSVFLALAACIAFGFETWPSFTGALADRASVITHEHSLKQDPLVSLFAVLRQIGVGMDTSWLVQLTVAAGMAALTWFLWSRPISYVLKAATLSIGALLASPHAFLYDQCILTIAIAFFVKDALARGFLRFERGTILACWFLLFFQPGPVIACAALLGLIARRTLYCPLGTFAMAPGAQNSGSLHLPSVP